MNEPAESRKATRGRLEGLAKGARVTARAGEGSERPESQIRDNSANVALTNQSEGGGRMDGWINLDA